MSPWPRVTLVALTLMACVGCDQVTKSLAAQHLRGQGAESFLRDTLRLQYAENPGAFMSLGAAAPAGWRTAVFTVGAGIALAGILGFGLLAAQLRPLGVLALSLMCGGGIGNLIDRVRYQGFVVDFLNVGIGSIRSGIFNLADVALMAGVLLLLAQQLLASAER